MRNTLSTLVFAYRAMSICHSQFELNDGQPYAWYSLLVSENKSRRNTAKIQSRKKSDQLSRDHKDHRNIFQHLL